MGHPQRIRCPARRVPAVVHGGYDHFDLASLSIHPSAGLSRSMSFLIPIRLFIPLRSVPRIASRPPIACKSPDGYPEQNVQGG